MKVLFCPVRLHPRRSVFFQNGPLNFELEMLLLDAAFFFCCCLLFAVVVGVGGGDPRILYIKTPDRSPQWLLLMTVKSKQQRDATPPPLERVPITYMSRTSSQLLVIRPAHEAGASPGCRQVYFSAGRLLSLRLKRYRFFVAADASK